MALSSTAKLHGQINNVIWAVEHERELLRTPRGVTVTEQTVRLANGTVVSDYLQIKMPSYTTVLPVTIDGKVICLRQYKHGVGDVSLTLPGGSIEDGETPLESAQRELLEETGYQCPHWQSLGGFTVGANQGMGKAHLYLAKNGHKVCEANSGDLEDMEIELLSVAQLNQAANNGDFSILSHASTIAMAGSYL